MCPKRARPARVELTNETDAALLACMAGREADGPCARAAWDVFYRRHVEYLYRVCLRAYGDVLGGEAGVADVVADTLRAAYENARKFDPAGLTDADRLRLRARAWLGWIARRTVQDLLRGRGRVPTTRLELGRWQDVGEPDRPQRAPSADEKLVRQALEALSEREQLVIRVTMLWYRPEKAHQRLPNDVARDLAAALGTTPENLRQIRRRALGRIARFVRSGGMADEAKDKPDGTQA